MPRRLRKHGETLKLVGAKDEELATRQHMREEKNRTVKARGKTAKRKPERASTNSPG